MICILKVLTLCIALTICSARTYAAEYQVMSWGVTDAAKTPFFINEIRLGCPTLPIDCVKKLNNYKNTNIRKVSLAIHWKSINLSDFKKDILAYSALIKNNSHFDVELSIDDFGTFLNRHGKQNTLEIIALLQKDTSPVTKKHTVGITLYDDEIENYASEISFPAVISGVNRIAIYLHHRNSYSRIDHLVKTVRTLSPNSKIYLGVYHYDRTEYISCTIGNSKKCTELQDIALFESALMSQVSLFATLQIDGLELYPGNFGSESAWAGWQNTKICSPERYQSCISNTRNMSDRVVNLLTDVVKTSLKK